MSHDNSSAAYLQRNYKRIELFTRNIQEIYLLPAFLHLSAWFRFCFMEKDTYFPHFYSCDLLLRDKRIRIP